MAALSSFILFEKYTTHGNQKDKDYAFKDLILDYIQKMTGPAGRENENDRGGDK
jgi:hypothetical protein